MKKVDEGIFLHRTNYSDSSLIITFFTKDSGIQKFIFKGGKKKAHNLYPMSVSELTFFGRPDSDLLTLTQVDSVSSNAITFDPMKSTIAFFLAEVVRKGLRESDRDENTYAFLKAQIDQLQNAENVNIRALFFLVRFTEHIGIQPLLNGEQDIFDLKEGIIGFIATKNEYVQSGTHVALIRNMLKGQDELDSDKDTRLKAFETMLQYYAYHVPNMDEISSLEIIRQVLYD